MAVDAAYILTNGSDAVYWDERRPDSKHVAVEYDNKQTWYATVYATEYDYLRRQRHTSYRGFGSRYRAVTWALQQLNL